MKPMLCIVLWCICLCFAACKNDDDQPTPEHAAFSGSFVSAVHPAAGTASIDHTLTMLTLSEFSTDSGPDLNLYLARDLNTLEVDFHDLGDLQGVNGSYNYALPQGVDFTEYRFVVIWCVAFSVNFGYAELMEQ